MRWDWANDYVWWKPEPPAAPLPPAAALIPARLTAVPVPARPGTKPGDPPAGPPLGLNLFRTPDAARRLLVAVRVPLKERTLFPTPNGPEPFAAVGGADARELAAELVRAVGWLHANGVTLNWYADGPASLVGRVGKLGDKPVLSGLSAATFGPPAPAAPAAPTGKPPVPRWWAWPRRTASWQRAFVAAAGAAQPTHLRDWHAVLRLIYFHRTAARLPTDRCTRDWLELHVARTERQLAAGFKPWLRTAFVARDSDQLHWGLGLAGGYRRWLRRLEAAIEPAAP